MEVRSHPREPGGVSDTDAEVRATGVGGERAPMDHMDCQERKSVIARRRGGMWNMNNMEYRKTRMQQRQAPRKTTSEKKKCGRVERGEGNRHCQTLPQCEPNVAAVDARSACGSAPRRTGGARQCGAVSTCHGCREQSQNHGCREQSKNNPGCGHCHSEAQKGQ